MTAREQLIAYLATLGALVLVFLAALVAIAFGADGATIGQAFGLGTITGGLIGVLRIPSSRSVTIDNAPGDPVPTTEAKGTAPGDYRP